MIDEATKRKMHTDLMRSHMSIRVDSALRGIQKTDESYHFYGEPFQCGEPPRIECMFHRIVLTGPYYGYPELKKRLGRRLKVDDRPQGRGYKKIYLSNVRGFRRSICTWPTSPRRPTRIEIVPSRSVRPKEHKRALVDLMNALPELRLSEVEYTIDVYCRYTKDVVNLFDESLRYLWVPSRKNVRLVTGQTGSGIIMNRLFHVTGRNAKVKVYERGPDHKKQGKGWPLHVCDRVRLELTAKCGKLRYHGFDRLYDLIEQPRFWELNSKLYRFKQFKNNLPEPWEYRARDDKGLSRPAFQAEYWHFQKLGYKVERRTRDSQDMMPLQDALSDAMKSFDREWEMS